MEKGEEIAPAKYQVWMVRFYVKRKCSIGIKMFLEYMKTCKFLIVMPLLTR